MSLCIFVVDRLKHASVLAQLFGKGVKHTVDVRGALRSAIPTGYVDVFVDGYIYFNVWNADELCDCQLHNDYIHKRYAANVPIFVRKHFNEFVGFLAVDNSCTKKIVSKLAVVVIVPRGE